MQNCLVCGQTLSTLLFESAPQPILSLNLPKSEEDAKDLLRYPMTMRQCDFCGHVWNSSFKTIPYAVGSTFMYNGGSAWKRHVETIADWLVCWKGQWEGRTVIDIGCGMGEFLRILKKKVNADYLGMEPSDDAQMISAYKVERDFFIPERDLKRYKPALLTCRHVLEHMENPREFLSEIAYWSAIYKFSPLCFFEVPRFDKALCTGRVGDFIYEHVSHFSFDSLKTILNLSHFFIAEIKSCDNDEVLGVICQPRTVELCELKRKTLMFKLKVDQQVYDVTDFLYRVEKEKLKVAFWGAAGKGAAFLNFHHITFGLVVDSDVNKVGLYVPGTGQLIQPPDVLLECVPDIIVITAPWHTQSILEEIRRRGFQSRVMTIQESKLVEIK